MAKRVEVPSGKLEGIEVDITSSNEQVSELRLEDGTVLKVKPSIIQVVRSVSQWDFEGNPIYNVRGQFTVLISEISEELKKRRQ